MKSWKKRWERELDEKIPALSKQTRETQIRASRKRGIFERFALYKKRIFACLAGGLAAMLCLCFTLPQLLTPQTPSNSVQSTPQPSTPTQAGYTMLAVEINPSAVFCVDNNGKVVSVIASNADADLILSNATRVQEMTGKTVDEAAGIFVDYAAQLGFLQFAQTSAIRVTACTDDAPVSAVCAAVEGYLKNKGALGVVVERNVEWNAFCEDFEIPKGEDLAKTAENAAKLSTLYSQRVEDWENAYGELFAAELTAAAQQLKEKYREQMLEYLIGTGIPEHLLEYALDAYSDEELVQLAKQLHLDLPIPESLLSPPQDENEYREKMQEYFTKRYEERIDEHKDEYQTQRPAIEEKDYRQHVDEVIEEYGSLESYWEKRKEDKKEKNPEKNHEDMQQKP